MNCSCGRSREELWKKWNTSTTPEGCVYLIKGMCDDCFKWVTQRHQMELEGEEPSIFDAFRDVIGGKK